MQKDEVIWGAVLSVAVGYALNLMRHNVIYYFFLEKGKYYNEDTIPLWDELGLLINSFFDIWFPIFVILSAITLTILYMRCE